MVKPVALNDVQDGHVALDLECLDRIYLNVDVPYLRVCGQVVGTGPVGSTEAHARSGSAS